MNNRSTRQCGDSFVTSLKHCLDLIICSSFFLARNARKFIRGFFGFEEEDSVLPFCDPNCGRRFLWDNQKLVPQLVMSSKNSSRVQSCSHVMCNLILGLVSPVLTARYSGKLIPFPLLCFEIFRSQFSNNLAPAFSFSLRCALASLSDSSRLGSS